MAHLEKQFTDQYGHSSMFFVVDPTEGLRQDDDGEFKCNVKVLAYKDLNAYVDGATIVDCFRPTPADKYRVSQVEKDAASGNTDAKKLSRAFIDKVTESIITTPPEDATPDEITEFIPEETNILRGNIGEMVFQDATIVE